MKKLALFIVLLLGVSAMWAQPQQGRQRMSIEDRQAQELKNLKEKLELNKEQEKSVISFQKAFAKEVNTLRSQMSQGGDRGAMREKMTTLRKKFDADVRTILNDEQKVKYDALLKKREAQMQQRQGQGQERKQGKKKKQR